MKALIFSEADSGREPNDVVRIESLAASPDLAREQVDRVLAEDPSIDVVAFWERGLPGIDLLHEFGVANDDAWHRGGGYSDEDEPDFLKYKLPLWEYRIQPKQSVDYAVNWRLDLRMALVRARTIRQLGAWELGFSSLGGAGLEMGLTWLRRGAILRQRPRLVSGCDISPLKIPLQDRYRLISLQYGKRAARYVLGRRLLSGAKPAREIGALHAALSVPSQAGLRPALGASQRSVERVSLPTSPTVSVILPTFGRYRYVAEVLGDLRDQSVRPAQILIADGNAPRERHPEVYEAFGDLPIEVIYPSRNGTCAPRNECLARATGEFVWFVDDDSRFEPNNLENHLRVLFAYGADVSVGPAYTRGRPEIASFQQEIACTFMDCGTTLCRRSILEKVGGFDLRLNDHLPGEDGELGMRFIGAGGVILNNPLAKRFHYLAPVGGARSSRNNIHRWRRLTLLPRPMPSVYYLGRRHFDESAALEAVFQAWLMAGWRRRDGVPKTRTWALKTAILELLALPVSCVRLARCVMLGRKLVALGPEIPEIVATWGEDRGASKRCAEGA